MATVARSDIKRILRDNIEHALQEFMKTEQFRSSLCSDLGQYEIDNDHNIITLIEIMGEDLERTGECLQCVIDFDVRVNNPTELEE